jgi:hypothetical protein
MSAERVHASGTRAADVGELDALYLFARAIQWRNGNDEAGWELLCALASSDPATRIAAQALLCETTG